VRVATASKLSAGKPTVTVCPSSSFSSPLPALGAQLSHLCLRLPHQIDAAGDVRNGHNFLATLTGKQLPTGTVRPPYSSPLPWSFSLFLHHNEMIFSCPDIPSSFSSRRPSHFHLAESLCLSSLRLFSGQERHDPPRGSRSSRCLGPLAPQDGRFGFRRCSWGCRGSCRGFCLIPSARYRWDPCLLSSYRYLPESPVRSSLDLPDCPRTRPR
jgi:hypothetical protein